MCVGECQWHGNGNECACAFACAVVYVCNAKFIWYAKFPFWNSSPGTFQQWINSSNCVYKITRKNAQFEWRCSLLVASYLRLNANAKWDFIAGDPVMQTKKNWIMRIEWVLLWAWMWHWHFFILECSLFASCTCGYI